MRCGTRSNARVRCRGKRPCRDIMNTPIAALPESFTSLSNLDKLCVRRALCARGCGTCASGALWSRPGLWLDAVRHAIGCARALSWVTSVQGDLEHADHRAARVVQQPVQSRLAVRPPISTCARGCGTCASGARWMRPGCGWMRCGMRSDARVRRRGKRPCRYIENTPIAALPESFTSLSNLDYLCVRRALCARGCGTCASGARWMRPGCGWMRCGTRSVARVRCRG
jgi:hypothetical protein